MEENIPTQQVETEFWEWAGDVAQKITMGRLRVLDHRDQIEEDMPLLKILFRIWSDGEFPTYQTKMAGKSQAVMQNDLFTEMMSFNERDCDDGKKIAVVDEETLKQDRYDADETTNTYGDDT